MTRLPAFELSRPRSLDEALSALSCEGARAIAGGSDVLPALKLGRGRPRELVSLAAVRELAGITLEAGALRIGAATRLDELSRHELVRAYAPALAEAAGHVGSPQLRRMGTLGGNICLDTRCRYVDQSPLFRQALGGCLKADGTACHVVPGGTRCVAALSADTVPALCVHEATVELASLAGRRELPIDALYGTDGARHLRLERGELVLSVRVRRHAEARFAYRKWAVRRAIDFPLVSVGVRLELRGGALAGGLVAAGVLGPAPRRVPLDALCGRALDGRLAEDVASLAFERCRPLPNVPYDETYRRLRLRIEVRRAVLALSGE